MLARSRLDAHEARIAILERARGSFDLLAPVSTGPVPVQRPIDVASLGTALSAPGYTPSESSYAFVSCGQYPDPVALGLVSPETAESSYQL
jgi:hypothetical protein